MEAKAQRNADPGNLQQPVEPPTLTAFQGTRHRTKGLVGRPTGAESQNILIVRKLEARLLLGSLR